MGRLDSGDREKFRALYAWDSSHEVNAPGNPEATEYLNESGGNPEVNEYLRQQAVKRAQAHLHDNYIDHNVDAVAEVAADDKDFDLSPPEARIASQAAQGTAKTRAPRPRSSVPRSWAMGAGVEKKVLAQLAGASGGRAYFVNMPRELPRLYADLAAALRSQYVVVYRSSRPADGKWRKIDVDVKRPGARVDATPGFPGR